MVPQETDSPAALRGARHLGAGSSALLSLLLALALLPGLARSPQSGDGAEQVATALLGGVLHAAGFPLQGWLNRLFILVPLSTPALRLSLLALLAHAGATFFVSETVRRLGGGLAARVLAAAAYALYPSTWALGVQPEVFAVTHLLVAASLWSTAWLYAQPRGRQPSAAALLGLIAGLGAAQHPIIVCAAPALLASLVLVMQRSDRPARQLFITAGVFLIVFTGLYLSLLLQRSDAPWPDWGKLTGASELVGLVLRADYGTLQLQATAAENVDVGLAVVGRELVRSWHLLLGFVVLGAFAIARSSRVLALGLVGPVAAATLFLLTARYGGHPISTTAYLERFSGTLVLPAAALVGVGFERAWRAAGAPWSRALLAIVVVGYGAHAWLSEREGADFRENRSLDLLREAIARTLPADAVWLAASDVEVLGGISYPDGSHRFPIASGLLGRPWYRERVLLALEPRLSVQGLREGGPYASGVEAIVAWADRQRIPVASTERSLLASASGRSKVLGVLFVTHPLLESDLGPETVTAAVALCPLVDELHPLPEGRQLFSYEAFLHFARAYDAASVFLQQAGNAEAAAHAAKVARALETRRDADGWRGGCDALTAALSTAPSPS